MNDLKDFKDFKSVISQIVSSAGFPVRLINGIPIDQETYHREFANFHIILKFKGDDHCQIELGGTSIKLNRNIDYYNSIKSIRTLRNRLTRLIDSEYDNVNGKDQKMADRLYNDSIVEQINEVNDSRQPNHNIVVDLDELDQGYRPLSIYYRSYELSPTLDEDGVVVFRETLFNISKLFTLNDVVSIIDVMQDS